MRVTRFRNFIVCLELFGLKAKRKVARYQRYGADVRRDVAHKTSHTLAVDPRYKLFVFEALKVKNMTKKAKPKQDIQGRWQQCT